MTLAAALLALMSAILSWFTVPWLIVIVAFGSAVAQGIQAFVQLKLSPPHMDPAYKLYLDLTKKQKNDE